MTRRKLVVKGHQGARVVFYVETYRGDVWITCYDCPFTSEIPWPYPGPPRRVRIGRFSSQAILEPTQADSLVDVINQAIQEARRYREDSAS